MAWELGEEPGETVGYQVRFEEAVGPRTRLRFVTEGVLTRRLLSDPSLKGVDAVVLDEFHERHLESDLALALLKRLQRTRPDLRIVVMSATLDADPVAQYLMATVPSCAPREDSFELSIQHLPYSSKPLEVQVREAVELLIDERHSGDILVVPARSGGDPSRDARVRGRGAPGRICWCCRCTAASRRRSRIARSRPRRSEN